MPFCATQTCVSQCNTRLIPRILNVFLCNTTLCLQVQHKSGTKDFQYLSVQHKPVSLSATHDWYQGFLMCFCATQLRVSKCNTNLVPRTVSVFLCNTNPCLSVQHTIGTMDFKCIFVQHNPVSLGATHVRYYGFKCLPLQHNPVSLSTTHLLVPSIFNALLCKRTLCLSVQHMSGTKDFNVFLCNTNPCLSEHHKCCRPVSVCSTFWISPSAADYDWSWKYKGFKVQHNVAQVQPDAPLATRL